MTPSPEEFLNRLRTSFPESRPKITTFPSGAFMIDVVIEEEVHVVAYLPELGYGVSRMSTATFGWEGVENSFESLGAAETYVLGLLKKEADPNRQRTTRGI